MGNVSLACPGLSLLGVVAAAGFACAFGGTFFSWVEVLRDLVVVGKLGPWDDSDPLRFGEVTGMGRGADAVTVAVLSALGSAALAGARWAAARFQPYLYLLASGMALGLLGLWLINMEFVHATNLNLAFHAATNPNVALREEVAVAYPGLGLYLLLGGSLVAAVASALASARRTPS